MTLWLRVRRAAACGAVAVGVVVVVLVCGTLELPIPAFSAFLKAAWPVALLAPLVLAIALTWALDPWDPRIESIASRPIAPFDALLAVGLTLVVASACWGLGAWGLGQAGSDAARSALGFVGLGLIGRWAGGRDLGSLLAVGYVVIAAFFGGATREDAAWWAWLARPAADRWAWEQAIGLLVIGGVLTMIGPRGRVNERYGDPAA